MALTPAQAKRRKKSTPSSIDRLDPEIRELIGHLRIDKGWTIDEIRQRLIDMGQQDVPSRSALGRHVMSLAEVQEKIRESKIWTEALAKDVDEDDDKMASVIEQLIQTNIFKLLIAHRDGDAATLDTKESKEAAQAQNYLLEGKQRRQAFVEKKEKRAADKARNEAAENAVKEARARGLSKETVDAIRFAVLGSDS